MSHLHTSEDYRNSPAMGRWARGAGHRFSVSDDRLSDKKETAMRLTSIRPQLLALVAVLTLVSVLARGVAAQEATPGPITPALSVIELAPGVTAEVFAGAPSSRANGQT